MPATPQPPPLKPAEPAKAGARRDRGWGIAIMNQLALPGFGTVMAGRKVGYFQLCFSVTGVICLTVFLGYAIPHLGDLLRQAIHPTGDVDQLFDFFAQWKPWLLTAMAGICLWLTAWLWALGTSVKEVQGDKKPRNR